MKPIHRIKRLINRLALVITSVTLMTSQADAGYRSAVSNLSDLPRLTIRPGNGDRTQNFQTIVNRASNRRTTVNGETLRGARIFVERGTYTIDRTVFLRSDVYMTFASGVVIRRTENGIPSQAETFQLSGGIRNVSIRGRSGSDRVRFEAPPAGNTWRAFSLFGVTNFEIRHIDVEEMKTTFSAFTCAVEDSVPSGPTPRDGTIVNIRVSGAEGGYGLIQIHSGEDLILRNLESEGGCALRLESGIESDRGIRNLFASNIRCTRGRAAVLFQPHAVTHRNIRIVNVRSFGSAFGVETRNGFVDRNSVSNGFTSPGTFIGVVIRNVVADFNSRQDGRTVTDAAHIRPAYFDLIPPRLFDSVRNEVSGDTLIGPAIGAVLVGTDYDVDLPSNEIRARNFAFQPNAEVEFRDSVLDRGRVRTLRDRFNRLEE